MGTVVLVMGESGSGKSTSLRNFSADEVGIFNVAGKPLPFKSSMKPMNVTKYAQEKNYSRYDVIKSMALKTDKKSIVIDDSQYLLAFESFDRAKETGFGKFTDIAVNIEKLVRFCVDSLPDDKIVYFLHHTETSDTGKTKAKTIGKMLDSQLTLEGLFSIVLLAQTDGKRHYFVTQSDGTTTAKSPMEMFDTEIDNDLKFVDQTIREYYDIT